MFAGVLPLPARILAVRSASSLLRHANAAPFTHTQTSHSLYLSIGLSRLTTSRAWSLSPQPANEPPNDPFEIPKGQCLAAKPCEFARFFERSRNECL